MKLNDSNNSLSDMIELHKIQLKLQKMNGNYDINEKIKNLHSLLNYKTKLRSKNGIAQVLYDLGLDYYAISDHEQAIKYHIQLLDMLNSLENTALKIRLFENLKQFYQDKEFPEIKQRLGQ